MTYLTLHDRERDLLVLDQGRRFYFSRNRVDGWLSDRLSETRKHHEELKERILAAFAKADVPRDKAENALDRLDAFGVEMDEALRTVHDDFVMGRALRFVVDELERFLGLLRDPSCTFGSVLGGPYPEGYVAMNASEVAFLRETFDAKRFRDTVVPPRPVPMSYGSTVARRITPMVGSYDTPAVPIIGLADLAKIG